MKRPFTGYLEGRWHIPRLPLAGLPTKGLPLHLQEGLAWEEATRLPHCWGRGTCLGNFSLTSHI